MENAIISGVNGLVGSALAQVLLDRNVDVLCLGRSESSRIGIEKNASEKAHYLQIDAADILSLPKKINGLGWMPGESCVFYNCVWEGVDGLTDGGIGKQISNAVYSSNSVVAAKEAGCVKFVNVGSIEETFAEIYLKNWSKKKYTSSQKEYAVAKLASRDMCSLVSYLEKIDYVHTRLSVPISSDLERGGYISSVLLKIKQGLEYGKPVNKQLFDITPIDDIANAYYLIGEKGENKADYYIGTSCPKTLDEYFRISKGIREGETNDQEAVFSREGSGFDLFNTALLERDTGFVLGRKFEDFAQRILLG